MSETRLPLDDRFERLLADSPEQGPRALKNFRYVLGSVNEEALKTWADLWMQLQPATGDAGLGESPKEGLRPACGWPEFLEKLWLLKHYLDYTHRLCRAAAPTAEGEP